MDQAAEDVKFLLEQPRRRQVGCRRVVGIDYRDRHFASNWVPVEASADQLAERLPAVGRVSRRVQPDKAQRAAGRALLDDQALVGGPRRLTDGEQDQHARALKFADAGGCDALAVAEAEPA